MTNKSVKFSTPSFAFSGGLILFAVIPLLHSELLLDYDLLPKTIALLVWSILVLLLILLRPQHFIIPSGTANKVVITSLVLFAGWIAFSTSKSKNQTEGIFEALRLLFSFVLIIPLIAFVNNKREKFNSFKWVNVAIVLFLLFGSIQLIEMFIRHIQKDELFVLDFSIRSTLSNKNFFSETLLLSLPFCIGGYILSTGVWKKISLVSAALCIVFIIILQTLSAWIGLLVCASIFGAFFVKDKSIFFFNKRYVNIRLILTCGVLLSVIIIWMCRDFSLFRPIKEKVHFALNYLNSDKTLSVEETSANSLFERLYLWKNTGKLIHENTWTGMGTANWILFWPKYGIGGASYLNSGVMHYEHPHNEFLFIAAEHGLIGLGLFLFILLSIVFHGIVSYRKSKDDNQRKIILLMLLGLLAFCIVSCFGYPLHRPYSAFLLALTIGTLLVHSDEQSETNRNTLIEKTSLTLLIAICVWMFYICIDRYNGEVNMRKAFKSQTSGNFPRMLTNVRKAENDYFQLDLTGTPMNWYKGFAHFHSGNQDSAYFYFKKAEFQNPYHVQILSDIGACLENKGKHDEAIVYFKKLLTIIPNYIEGKFNLTVAYYNTGKINEAYNEIRSFTWDQVQYKTAATVIAKAYTRSVIDSTVSDIQIRNNYYKSIENNEIFYRLFQYSQQSETDFMKVLKDSCFSTSL